MTLQRGPAYPRTGVTAVVLATGLAILVGRLAWLGTVEAKDGAGSVTAEAIAAPRGNLWDRRGNLVAAETYAYDLAAVPRDIADHQAFAQAVAPVLGTDPAQVVADMADRPYWAILARGLSRSQADALRALGLDGLRLERVATRSFVLGAAAGHLTGFWNPYDRRPYYGVEARHDRELQGRPGSVAGNLGTDPRAFRPPRAGNDLVLTIDRDIQLAAAQALDEAVREESATGGTVIVLDPATGAVLANVSWPTYDPNAYSQYDPGVFSDPSISALYEPGSVIKALTMAAAIDAGVTSPGATYEDEGTIDVDGAPISNWDRLPHGTTTMTDLLAKSLNIGAVHLAQGLGAERFYAYMAAFGFGLPTDIDLDGEVAGLMSGPGDAGWGEGTLARNGFGQAMAATPMQVVAAMAALANDGTLMRPHVVGARMPAGAAAELVAPQPMRQVVRPDVARAVRAMLVEVVAGHTTQAAVPGYRVGGKTGTSEIATSTGYEDDKTIASFCGFLPAEHPRVVILVKVDRPNAPRGSDVAAPVFREVALAAIAALAIPPDDPAALQEAQP